MWKLDSLVKIAFYKTIACLLCPMFILSCVTSKMWQRTDPNEYVAIKIDSISEQELNRKGLKYYKDEERGLFYIEKSSARKLGDYTMRTLATPVTITIDAATVIVVTAFLFFFILNYDKSHYENMRQQKEREKENEIFDPFKHRFDKKREYEK